MNIYLKSTFITFFVAVAIIIISFLVLVFVPTVDPLKPNATNSLAITSVTVINPGSHSILEEQTVLIEDKRIHFVGDSDAITPPKSVRHVDGTGKYLIPALWDMHTHWISDFAPQLTMPLFIANGITNIRDLGGGPGLEKKRQWREKILTGDILGPRIVGQANLFIRHLKNKNHAFELLSSVSFEEPDFVKVYNDVLPDPFFALLDEANRLNVTVLGHKPRSVSAVDASRAGYKSFEHARIFLFECYSGAPSLRQEYFARYANTEGVSKPIVTPRRLREMIDNHDATKCQRIMETMAKNGTWYVPTHITRKMDAFADNQIFRQDKRLRYIHFLQRMLWMMDADAVVNFNPSSEARQTYMDFYLEGLKLSKVAHQIGVQILAGSDANDTYSFPGMGLHDELEELTLAGLSPMEALKTATFGPAEYFGLANSYGSIEVGKIADMVLLDANPTEHISNTTKINQVIFEGAVYDKADLNDFLEYVARNANSYSIGAKLIWSEFVN